MSEAVGAPRYDSGVLVVVPSRRASAQEADRRLRPSTSGLASSAVVTRDVVTLRELVERGASASPSPRTVLRGAAFQLFVAAIVEAAGSRARSLFGAAVDSAGATRAIAAAVAEIRMAALTAEDVEASAGESRGASRRLSALADILRRYEKRLDATGVWDVARLHREVAELVRNGGWPDPIGRLEIRGLYDVTPLQAELLVALARRAESVRVEVPFDPHDEASTAFAFPYVKMWESLDDPALDIEQVFLPPWQGNADSDIVFAAAIDPSDEARLVADWVRARAEKGVRLEEIGVVAASGAPLGPIARELVRRGIAFHARRSTPLAETPLFAALLLPFRLFEDGFRRVDLLAWVTSPLTARLDPDLLRPTLARGPAAGGGLGDWNRALSSARGDSAAILTASLRDLFELGRRESSPFRFWSDYTAILARVGLESSSSPAPERAWSAWEDVLAELRTALETTSAWNGRPAGWRIHRSHLAFALGSRRAAEGIAGRGVSILTPQDARGLHFRHSALMGLVQGSLLAPRPSAAIFGDEERAALNETLGRRLFRLAAEDAREGSLLLRERLHATGESVLLVHAATDGDGNPLLPALEVETLRQRLERRMTARSTPDPAWRLERSAESVAALQRIERFRTAFFTRGPDTLPSRYDGAFAAAWAETLKPEFEGSGSLAVWSASRLEAWRQCPHQFFQRYVLGLRPPVELPLEAELTVIGRVVHFALQRLYEAPLESGPPDRDRIDEALRRGAEHPEIRAIDRGHPDVWSATLRRAAAVLDRYFRFLREKHPPGDFRVAEREIAFGPDEELADVVVETALGPVRLRGRIDRLDLDPVTNRLRVIDYKYSRADRHRAAVDPDRCGADRFQLYVYMLAALAWMRHEGLPPPASLEGLVHCLREPSVLKPLGAPEPDVIAHHIAEVIETAAMSVFDANPAEPDDCRFCDFRRSCRIATVAGPLPAGTLEDEP